MKLTAVETKAYKTAVTFVGTALTLASTLGLPHPWDIIVGLVLGAGTTAGVFVVRNPLTSAVVEQADGTESNLSVK